MEQFTPEGPLASSPYAYYNSFSTIPIGPVVIREPEHIRLVMELNYPFLVILMVYSYQRYELPEVK